MNKVCKIPLCKNKVLALKFCQRHYYQLRRFGKILQRTKADKNEIFDRGEYYEMALYNRKQEIIAYSKFDKKDLKLVLSYRWFLNHNYVATNLNQKNFSLHTLLIKAYKGLYIDHINRDSLDNRRCNLRTCTQSANAKNRIKHKNSNSIYKGVYWHKKNKNWVTVLKSDKKVYYIGNFLKERWAGMAYDIWAKDLHGGFASLNF